MPGFGSPESARPGNPIGGLTIKGGKNPGGTIIPAKLIWSPKSNYISDDCDDAGLPIFLGADGVPTGSASAIGPVRWCAPECMWEPSIRMIVCPAGIYSPDLGTTVSRVQDHNSSRSNKSSN